VIAAAALGPPGGRERRRAPRVTPEELTEPVSVVGTRILDISRGGLLIEAPVPLPSRSTLRLRLVVGGIKTELETRVASSRHRPSGRPWGVGVEFAHIPADIQARLARALETWRAKPRSA
jgi:hypothetical protein